MSNISIFPLVQKYPQVDNKTKIDLENIPETEIEKIANHYIEQLVTHFDNHGFPDTGFYWQDVEFLHNVVESVLMRSVGMHHPLQEVIDKLMIEVEEESDASETKENEE